MSPLSIGSTAPAFAFVDELGHTHLSTEFRSTPTVLVPVNADVWTIDVTFVDEADPHVDAIGVKGLGEIGTTGITAAIANAVYHATGVRVRDLPITIDKLLP